MELRNKKPMPDNRDFHLSFIFSFQVLSALVTAEKKKKPSIESMFDDVYDVLTPELERQKAELMDHLKQYGKHYNMDQFAK